MSNALAGIIFGTVLLPCLDSMNNLLVTLREYGTVGYDERVGIWQEDAEQTLW